MRECRRYLIQGRVQGVCYRMSAQQTGIQYGLTGWVRNLPNGDVEAIACGDADNLKRFERWLWQGPQMAEVKSVNVETVHEGPYNDFLIR